MNFSKTQIIIIFGVILFVAVIVLIFVGVLPGRKQDKGVSIGTIGNQEQTGISFWGVESEQAIRSVIDSYSQINRAYRIDYTRFDENDYEKKLIDALAAGRGPDIFMFHNTWLAKHFDKIAPLSPTSGFTITQIKQLFPQVVEADFTKNGIIYALPIYIDTLALIYNKDYFDAKGVAVAPKTWSEFQYVVPRLRELDFGNKIVRAAVAIGGSEKSIDKAVDLLSLIMLQNGKISDQFDRVDFRQTSANMALQFYIQFSNPNSSVYTWNDNFRNSLDSFAQGAVAAIFNYQSSIPVIKSRNPYLNFEVSAMLQKSDSGNPVNYANYWGLTVSSQSKNYSAAWNFIRTVSADSSIAEKYIQESKRPPALRNLIQKYLNDPDLGVFSRQVLTAKSWVQPDSAGVRKIFSNMIEWVLSGRLSINQALEQAENEVNSL